MFRVLYNTPVQNTTRDIIGFGWTELPNDMKIFCERYHKQAKLKSENVLQYNQELLWQLSKERIKI